MFPGFEQRLQNEITRLAPESIQVNVYAPKNRNYYTWIGASILSQLENFPQMVITKNAFLERGEKVISEKCP